MTVAPSYGMSSMRPRFAADYRTLLWVIMAGALLAFVYWRPEYAPYLFVLNCYFALACGVIAHNHNHCPTFADKRANQLFANVISVFYGYPTFAWIPTHNLNHHKHVNKAGDATITWRFTNRHNFLVASTYFFVSAYFQSGPIDQFVKRAKASNPALYAMIKNQVRAYLALHLTALGIALALHGLKTGLYVWALTVLCPAVFSLWTVHLFNYEQHVHTDPWSDHNHSRSFVGGWLNFMLFNNGLHAAHHEHPGTHWSKLPEAHAALAPKIDPQLKHQSMWFYFFRQYFLAMFIPSLGTKQVGRPGFEPPDGKAVDLTSDDVDSAEAGTNAQMFGV